MFAGRVGIEVGHGTEMQGQVVQSLDVVAEHLG